MHLDILSHLFLASKLKESLKLRRNFKLAMTGRAMFVLTLLVLKKPGSKQSSDTLKMLSSDENNSA